MPRRKLHITIKRKDLTAKNETSLKRNFFAVLCDTILA